MDNKHNDRLIEPVGTVFCERLGILTDSLGVIYTVYQKSFPDASDKFSVYKLSKYNPTDVGSEWSRRIMDMFKISDITISLDGDFVCLEGVGVYIGVRNPYQVKFTGRWRTDGCIESLVSERISN